MSAHYETAYHALTAALHYAEDLGDDQRVLAVEQAAKVQRDWIDAHAPDHRMSTQSAAKRGGTNLYEMLTRQAAMRVLIIQHKHRQEHTKHLPWPGDAIGKT